MLLLGYLSSSFQVIIMTWLYWGHTQHSHLTYVPNLRDDMNFGNLIGIVFLGQTKQNESTSYPVNPVGEVPRKDISKFIENWVVVSDICYFHHYFGK